MTPPFSFNRAASSLAAFSARGRAWARFQARATSGRISSRGTCGARVLDLAGQEASAEDVGQLDGLVEAGLGIEELVGELAAAAEPGQADLGRRDLAVMLGLVSG